MIKTKIQNLLPKNPGPIGGIYSQNIRCGKSVCRCANGPPHEGYHYYIRRIDGKLVKTYVPKALVKEVTRFLEMAKKGRRLVREMTRASNEASRAINTRLRDQDTHLKSLEMATRYD